MFKIDEDKTIHLTRGDVANIVFSAAKGDEEHTFETGDIVRLKVFERKDCGCVVLQKDTKISDPVTEVEIFLGKEDTKIGETINKPKDFWYEIELNPDTKPQTLVGYDEDGPKLFMLYPEGDDTK